MDKETKYWRDKWLEVQREKDVLYKLLLVKQFVDDSLRKKKSQRKKK